MVLTINNVAPQSVYGAKPQQPQQLKTEPVHAAAIVAPRAHADPFDALEYHIAGHPSHAEAYDALEYRIAGHPSHADAFDALEYRIEGHPSHADEYDALEYRVPGHEGHVDPFAALEYKVGADPYADPVGPRSLRQWWNDRKLRREGRAHHQPAHEEASHHMAAQTTLHFKKVAAAL